jgi:hypothetical protein
MESTKNLNTNIADIFLVDSLENQALAYGHSYCTFSPNEKNVTSQHLMVTWAKSKILKSLLEVAILKEMNNRAAISVPGMIDFLSKRYLIQISPGTVYPVFEKLEKQG